MLKLKKLSYMKSKSIILLVIAVLFVMAGCEKTDKGPVLKSSITPPSLIAPTGGTSFVITEAIENDTMTKFTWAAPDYGFQAAVTYTLQITLTGDFKDASDLAVTTSTKVPILNSKMNTTLLILGAFPTEEKAVSFRVKAVINSAIAAVYSDTAVINVTPFEKLIVYPELWVPGDLNGWNHGSAKTIASVKSDNKYEGFVDFPGAGSFKFTSVAGWSGTNYGDGGSGTLSTDGGAGNLSVASAGYYKLNANLNELTWSATKTDWGLIGDATPGGWSTDSNLTYDAVNDIWTITVDLIVGGIKFRANDAWDLNFGDTGGDRKLEYGGDNIPVAAAGNYTITLDLGHPVYKYKMVKN
jgi:hypothetical protein